MSKLPRRNKLNFAQVAEIRRRYATGVTQRQLAQENHVTIGTIYNIVHNVTWQTAAPAEEIGQAQPPREFTEEEIAASQRRLEAMLGITQPPSDSDAKKGDV